MNKVLLALGLVVLIIGSSIVAFYYIPRMWRTTSYETVPSEEQGIPESPEGETEQFVKLNVDLFPKGGQWVRDSETDLPLYESTVSYVVSNYGTANADSVKVTIQIDGVVYKQFSLWSLAPTDSSTDQFAVSVHYDSSKRILLSASCQDSEDTDTLTVDATLPRAIDSKIAKLYVTPEDSMVEQTLDSILKNPIIPDWIEIRDWIANHIEYEYDNRAHGVSEYWQLPRETFSLGTGDCEDFSMLLCSLYRAVGWDEDEVYVVVGKDQDGYGHAWVKLNVDIIGWQYIEPQWDAWSTFIGDYFGTLGYTAEYIFNDVYFETV